MKLKEYISLLEKKKEEYDELRLVISDDFNDDFFESALEKVEKLKVLRKELKDLENKELN